MLGSMVRGEVVLGLFTIEIRSSSFRFLLLMIGVVVVVCLGVTSVLFVLVLLLAL